MIFGKIHSIGGKVYLFWIWMIEQSINSDTNSKNVLSISVCTWPCRVFLSILLLFCIQHLADCQDCHRVAASFCIHATQHSTHQHRFTAGPFDKHKAKLAKCTALVLFRRSYSLRVDVGGPFTSLRRWSIRCQHHTLPIHDTRPKYQRILPGITLTWLTYHTHVAIYATKASVHR